MRKSRLQSEQMSEGSAAAQTVVKLRGLTHQEAQVFSDEIRLTPGITAYTPSELKALPTMLVLEQAGEAAGILAYTTTRHFVEMKVLIVREQFRGRGFGRSLFDEFMNHTATSDRPAYTVTKNLLVKHLVQAGGYRPVSYWRLPLSCKLHQLKMVASAYRIREYVRKRFLFPRSGRFEYWLKQR